MPDFDDLLSNQPQTAPAPQQDNFDKDAWAAQKKQQREDLYTLADETAMGAIANPARFTQYLDVQARFDRYSPTNALLILAQRPDATQFGDLDHWKRERVFIKRDEMPNAITILEPGKQYHREDGGVGTSMNAKRVYDMSQAERPRLQPQPRYDDRALVQAVIKASPIPVEGVDQLSGERDAAFDGMENKIFVQRGMEAPAIVRAVAREACYARMDTVIEDDRFDARAGAYLICKKFGVDTQGIDLSDVKARFGCREAKEVREVLSSVRNIAGEIAGRMAKELEPPKREAER